MTSPVPAVPVPEEERRLLRLGTLLDATVAHFPDYSAGKWRLVGADGEQLWDPTPMAEAWAGGAPTGPLCAATKRDCEALLARLRREAFDAIRPTPPAPVVGEGERVDTVLLRLIAAEVDTQLVEDAADELDRLRALPAAPTTPDIADERVGWPTGDDVAEALNIAWRDFVDDTGCFPDCIWVAGRGPKLAADFGIGNFATFVANWLNVKRKRRPAAPSTPGDGQEDAERLRRRLAYVVSQYPSSTSDADAFGDGLVAEAARALVNGGGLPS